MSLIVVRHNVEHNGNKLARVKSRLCIPGFS